MTFEAIPDPLPAWLLAFHEVATEDVMAFQSRGASRWISSGLILVLGVLGVVYVLKRPEKPPQLPGGQSTYKGLPDTIDVGTSEVAHYLAALAGYDWYAVCRVRPIEITRHQTWNNLSPPSKGQWAIWLRRALGDLPFEQVREWTGVLAHGYAIWTAELQTPLSDAPLTTWEKIEKEAYGVPVYRVAGGDALAGYVILPNPRLVVACTHFDPLARLVAATLNPALPLQNDLFGPEPIQVTVADLRWLRSPLQGVTLGPATKDMPAVGRVAYRGLADWTKDLAGGRATLNWRGDGLEFSVSLKALNPKCAKNIADHLDEAKDKAFPNSSVESAIKFTSSGDEISARALLTVKNIEHFGEAAARFAESRAR